MFVRSPEASEEEKERPSLREGMHHMTRDELNRFRGVLETRESELSQLLGNRDGIVIEKVSEQVEGSHHAAERELASMNIDRMSGLHECVRAAISRIEDGTYGICLSCKRGIGRKRLEAVPWASFCIWCQEVADHLSEEALAEAMVGVARARF